MDLTPGPAEDQERSDEPRLTSFVTKMIGHQRTMAAGLVAVTTGMEQIATGYEALQLDIEAIRAAAYRAGREDAAKEVISAADDHDHADLYWEYMAMYGRAKEIVTERGSE